MRVLMYPATEILWQFYPRPVTKAQYKLRFVLIFVESARLQRSKRRSPLSCREMISTHRQRIATKSCLRWGGQDGSHGGKVHLLEFVDLRHLDAGGRQFVDGLVDILSEKSRGVAWNVPRLSMYLEIKGYGTMNGVLVTRSRMKA